MGRSLFNLLKQSCLKRGELEHRKEKWANWGIMNGCKWVQTVNEHI